MAVPLLEMRHVSRSFPGVRALDDVSFSVGPGEVSVELELAKLSVMGVGMRTHTGVATRMFGALAEREIFRSSSVLANLVFRFFTNPSLPWLTSSSSASLSRFNFEIMTFNSVVSVIASWSRS